MLSIDPQLILFVVLFFALLGGLLIARDRYDSPIVIHSVSWFLIISSYVLLPHAFYPLSVELVTIVGVWFIVMYVVFAVFTTAMRGRCALPVVSSQKILIGDTLFYISLPMALCIFILSWQIGVSGSGSFFVNLRQSSTGLGEDVGSLGFTKYFYPIINVAFFYELTRDRIKKLRFSLLLVIVVLLAIITVAKTNIVFLAVSCVVLRSMIGKPFPIKKLIVLLLFILLLMSIMQILKTQTLGSNSWVDIFYIYLLSGLPALDSILAAVNTDPFGWRTFKFLYAVGTALGFGGGSAPSILEWVSVPLPTNIYTVIYPFYYDFNIVGVVVFSLLYGFLFGGIYYLAKVRGRGWVLAYSIFVPMLALQFTGEYFFTTLSQSIQLLLLSHLAFVRVPIKFREYIA